MIDNVTTPLFVPATRHDRFVKACQSGADAIIVDLEDAVASSEKEVARSILDREIPLLATESVLVGVRVNSVRTEHFAPDIELLQNIRNHLGFVVLPEVQGKNDLRILQQELGEGDTTLPVVALIETSRGLVHSLEIAEHPIVRRLALGAADLSNEWEVEPTLMGREFDYARQNLVVASRAAGLNGPLDTPHMNIQDGDGLSECMQAIVQLGMKGKQCIHPNQVPTVRRAFLVSDDEYARLVELIQTFEAAEGGGNASIRLEDGSFIDYPVYHRAVKHVEIYEQFHRK